MLYILPPPSAPSPPSAWNSILCAGATSAAAGGGNNQQSSGGAGNRNNVITNGTITSWGVVEPPDKKPFFKVRSSHMKQRAATVPKDSGSGIPLVEDDSSKGGKSLSECYFAGKGAALVLPPHDRGPKHSRRASVVGSDIQQHLQAMFYLLRPEETLKMAVKLESARAGRTRYLVVVSRPGRKDAEESCLLGIDCNEQTTVGLVLRVLADTGITLDGDGGFSVSVCGRQHIFKPVSVQAMWSALQTLHKVSSKAREENYFLGGLTHEWVSYYEQRIESDRSCLNEWHAMDSLESRRPPSPDSLRTKPRQRDETEQVIRSTLKEIMMSVDLDEVTSKYIRSRLEEDLDMDLGEFKSFIDQEMLTILGQMDSPTEIFDHVYLGSEWNASNLEELQKNGVRHILNVTREIDNFFPGMFDYHNIRVYDDEKTDLLKHWDNTFKYIHQAKEKGSKVLVHCKMGVSRSASVVIAYAMKAYDWDFSTAMQHVKEKRTCIKPNTSFLAQLETYQGILDAMKNKEKLQRSKSETNLKSPVLSAKSEKIIPGSEPTPMVQAMQKSALQSTMSGHELRQLGNRPKSWSPDNRVIANLLPDHAAPISISLEHLNRESSTTDFSKIISDEKVSNDNSPTPPSAEVENRNVLMPCGNGQSYSVSQNQIFHLPGSRKVSSEVEVTIPSVKYRVIELESQSVKQSTKPQLDKKGLVLNLTSQFENNASKPSSPSPSEELSDGEKTPNNSTENTEPAPEILTSILVKKEIWDPGEVSNDSDENNVSYKTCDLISSSTTTNNDCLVWTPARSTENTNSNEPNKNVTDSDVDVSDKSLIKTVSTRPVVPLFKKEGDPFSNQLDRIFDREERKEHRKSTLVTNINVHSSHQDDNQLRDCPSRQSSWSSYDSAVVLGYQGESRDVPSRHSSWGSGDTRTLPSRNSSWGSYDIKITNGPVDELSEQVHPTDNLLENSSSGMFPYDKNDMPPWYPGTVKRTKQKLEEGTVKRICSDNKQTLCPYHTNSAEILKCKYTGNKNVVEAINTGMLCCAVSPALCTCGENDSTIKNESNTCKVVTESKNIESNGSTKKIDINSSSNNSLGIRLSASAPENSSISLLSESDITSSSSLMDLSVLDQQNFKNEDEANVTYSNVKQHKLYIENLSKNKNPKRHFLVDDSAADSNKNIVGIVKNLKREFEAKTSPKIDKNVDLPIVESDTSKNKVKSSQISQATPLETGSELVVPEAETKGKVKSLPSSPVSVHVDLKQETASSEQDLEDISVKKLVGKYEISNWNSDRSVITSFKSNESNDKSFRNNQKRNCENSVQKYPPAITKTSLLVHNLKNKCDTECKWPPVAPTVRNPAPSVVLASVVTSAANKKQQQHGKTHPLTRLAVNKQHRNSPVYNTM